MRRSNHCNDLRFWLSWAFPRKILHVIQIRVPTSALSAFEFLSVEGLDRLAGRPVWVPCRASNGIHPGNDELHPMVLAGQHAESLADVDQPWLKSTYLRC